VLVGWDFYYYFFIINIILDYFFHRGLPCHGCTLRRVHMDMSGGESERGAQAIQTQPADDDVSRLTANFHFSVSGGLLQ